MILTPIPAALVLVLALLGGARQAGREPELRPDPALQAGIRRLVAAASPDEQHRALDALRAEGGGAHERLVPQLLLFSREARDTKEAMVLGFVLRQLAVPAEHVLRALVPLLESPDVELRADVGGVLSEYEHLSPDRGADFSVYRPFLEGEPPPGLVRHVLATDPGAALLVLTRAQVRDLAELRALLWAEHEVADALWKLRNGFVTAEELPRAASEALAQLDFLARHARWWARAFAARIGSQEPGLAVRMEELRGDPNALVRELAGGEQEGR